MFKQTQTLFKQICDHKSKVVGIAYFGSRTKKWQTIGYSQVKALNKQYEARAERGEVSQAVANALDQWEWALSLFGPESEQGRRGTMITVKMQDQEAGVEL